MATITAIANGNWVDASTWDLNRVPDVDDDVYLEDYIVSNLPSTVNVKSINNNLGYAKFTNNPQTINANINSGQGVEVLQMNQSSRSVYINGDVNGCLIRTNNDNYQASQTQNIIITGNIEINNNSILWNKPSGGNFHYNYWNLTINGNVLLNGNSIILDTQLGNGNTLITITVNGNTIFNGNSNMGKLKLYQNGNKAIITYNGNVFLNNSIFVEMLTYFSQNTITINGNFEIMDWCGINMQNFQHFYLYGKILYHNKERVNSLYNAREVHLPNNYQCEYVGNDTPYFYCVNIDAFPVESNVKYGVPYLYGQLEGTYLPDYPQQSTVLNGVTYDNGNLEGTLQIPTPPSTSDIVTAITNSADLGTKIASTDTNVSTLLSRLTSTLTSRLGQSVTSDILQQVLDAHLNN